jgi:hypothetical protein
MRTRAGSTQACISLLVAIQIAAGWACGSSPTSPSPAPGPTTAPSGPPPLPVRVFGVVTSDRGTPLADATVILTYQPELAATQSVNTRTSRDGRYELQLSAQQPGNVSAVVRVISNGDYNLSEQFVRVGGDAERNFRLRPVRTISTGQSLTVTFDADSSVCSSVLIAGLCEWVRVQSPATFTYTLDVRASGTGGVVPTLVGALGTSRVTGQETISLQVGNEDVPYSSRVIDVAISIPPGTAPQLYEVTVSAPDWR